jgi:hypothetical protein
MWLLSNLDSEVAYRIAKFLCRPYWSRIWIMQEVAMACEDSFIICGARCFPTSYILGFGKHFSLTQKSQVFNSTYKIGRRFDPNSNGISIGFLERGLGKLSNLWDLRNHLDVITS